MAGLFDDFGVSASDVSENPFEITVPNRYTCVLTESDIKEFGKEVKVPYWVNVYTIKGGKEDGKSANTLHRMTPWTKEERATQGDTEAMNARLLSGYKKELMNLGIPEEAMNAFDPKNPNHRNKIIGLKGSAWFGPNSKNPGYNEIRDFERSDKLAGENDTDTPASVNADSAQIVNNDVDMSALEGW